ncbi:MAG: type II toxin-antitoxin system HicA family toxin [Fidelibacterota bacterium]
MGKHEKFLLKILSGSSDRNINFDDLCSFLKRMGFKEYSRSSHHLFRKEGVEEMINLQKEGNNAKPYQVKQVRNVIQKYGLGG